MHYKKLFRFFFFFPFFCFPPAFILFYFLFILCTKYEGRIYLQRMCVCVYMLRCVFLCVVETATELFIRFKKGCKGDTVLWKSGRWLLPHLVIFALILFYFFFLYIQYTHTSGFSMVIYKTLNAFTLNKKMAL